MSLDPDSPDFDKMGECARTMKLARFRTRIKRMAKERKPFYMDDIYFDDLIEEGNHYNMIGIALRTLVKDKVIVPTGRHRKSTLKSAKGRRIFEYILAGAVDPTPILYTTVKQITADDIRKIGMKDTYRGAMTPTQIADLVNDVSRAVERLK